MPSSPAAAAPVQTPLPAALPGVSIPGIPGMPAEHLPHALQQQAQRL